MPATLARGAVLVTVTIEKSAMGSKPKRSLLFPLLLMLFVVSFAFLTTLVVEQGSTIDSQRVLIKRLFDHTTQLSAIKGNNIQTHQSPASVEKFRTKSPAAIDSQVQAPSSQAATSSNSKNHQKLGKQVMQRPPRSADTGDIRRTALSI